MRSNNLRQLIKRGISNIFKDNSKDLGKAGSSFAAGMDKKTDASVYNRDRKGAFDKDNKAEENDYERKDADKNLENRDFSKEAFDRKNADRKDFSEAFDSKDLNKEAFDRNDKRFKSENLNAADYKEHRMNQPNIEAKDLDKDATEAKDDVFKRSAFHENNKAGLAEKNAENLSDKKDAFGDRIKANSLDENSSNAFRNKKDDSNFDRAEKSDKFDNSKDFKSGNRRI